MRLAVNEIGNGLGLRQIELVVEEGAAGEFAGPCETRPELQRPLQQHVHDHRPAMPLQLQYILTGKGSRPTEKQCDALVNRLTSGVEESRMPCEARAREFPKHGLGDHWDTRTGDADDPNATAPGGSGYGRNSIVTGVRHSSGNILP